MPIDFSSAWNTAVRIINQSISLIPNFVIACITFLIFLVAASFSSSLVCRVARQRRKHQGIALLLGRLVHTSIVILGFLVALSVIAPSFQASDLIKVLGIGSVAVGFAFQNILQNFLAGLLLLWSEPFRIGDDIKLDTFEGEVEDIQARATIIRTPDERRVVIPNADLFTHCRRVRHPVLGSVVGHAPRQGHVVAGVRVEVKRGPRLIEHAVLVV